MRTTLRGPAPLLLVALMLLVNACGKSSSSSSTTAPNPSTSPASPSVPAAPPPASSGAGATISGTVIGAVGATALRTMGSAGSTVSVVGTSLSVTTDGGGNFTLTTVPAGDVTLSFGAGAVVTITGVSDREQIHITVSIHGGTADLDDDERETSDNRAEVEGPIVSINATARTLVVGRRQTSVLVPTGTPIHHGGTAIDFSQLVAGDRVHIHAMKSGTTLTATDVQVQNDKPQQPEEAEIDGTVSAVSGACPTPMFVVNGTMVMTNASTALGGAGCAAIIVGAHVEVKGVRQANGSVLATRVSVEVEKAEVSGKVTAVTGACPTLTLTINGATVLTNGATQFKSACGNIKVGAKVKAEGTRQGNGSVLATNIDLDD